MMATYKKFNDSILEIEIYGKVTGDEYVAFGFSTDIKMVHNWQFNNLSIRSSIINILQGNDSIVECVLFGDVANAHQSYNMPGADDNKRLPAPVIIIEDGKYQLLSPITFSIMLQQLFEVTDSMYVDGYVYCRVQHPIKFINNNQDFDLRQPYHLLMATGPADSSKVYWQKKYTAQTTCN